MQIRIEKTTQKAAHTGVECFLLQVKKKKQQSNASESTIILETSIRSKIKKLHILSTRKV